VSENLRDLCADGRCRALPRTGRRALSPGLPKTNQDISHRLIFVCLTNILLITALVSLVSNSLTEVRPHLSLFSGDRFQDHSCQLGTLPETYEAVSNRSLLMLERSIFSSEWKWPCSDHHPADSDRYSIYVLESSTSRRLTYFLPPLV
jgi:hypothetical protein